VKEAARPAASASSKESAVRLYGELAPWFHLLTHPSDYEEEAALYIRTVEAIADGPAETLLELGSGGGNNASYLKQRFTCTLSDLSEEMRALSGELNPECEHVRGDMRTLRLGRTFDVVFLHDAVMYMTSEADLAAAIETAALHTRPGGVALFVPDDVRESFQPGTSHGGHDGDDGRALRYLEWKLDPDPADTTYDVDFVLLVREPDGPVRVEYERHTLGLFPQATWLRLMREVGLEPVETSLDDPFESEHSVFAARRSPVART
jgi:SAM-dependent methyltransferase